MAADVSGGSAALYLAVKVYTKNSLVSVQFSDHSQRSEKPG